ncbi:ABC transporter ATP-binding protein [Oceanirhabdus seepicola]|uniref:ABC transporter ATP-binding protein n=1 Tax=Oceanirhabdus seepicola TaxID=2828781 RepID=A0A9J6P4J1_9CLOT|nr:ABC transporter ATP-binding protein [Oceanirhabdus seepicola]MCM1991148.1 ABC transporter ATP-binding protein [Oceanirhabdus seepicola]
MEFIKKLFSSLFFKYSKKQKLKMSILGIAMIITVGLQIVSPQITRFFLDAAKNGEEFKHIMYAAIMFIGVAVVQQIFSLITRYLGEIVAWKATNEIRIDLVKHCLGLDMTFHKEYQSGELIERIDGDVSGLFGLFSGVVLNVINNFLLLVGILVVLLFEDWRISLGLCIFSLFAMYTLWFVKRKTEVHWEKASEMNAKFYGFIGEQISSTEDIATCNGRNHVMKKFYKIIRKMFPVIRRAELTWASIWSTTTIIFAVGNIIALGLSTYLWSKGAISIGTVYLIFNYTEHLRRPIEQMKVDLQELQVSGASVSRINELFNIESKLVKGAKELCNDKSGTVEVKNVYFEYEEGATVLNDISIEVKSGNILGILGHTGSGKTTLARLLVRLYDVTHGQVLINGQNIKSITFEDLRKNIAYVTQEVQLFNATVRDNITMFNEEIDDKTILHIIDELGLSKWLDKLPNGLDTNLGSNSTNLSAGESQLLAFVRVFLKNPSVIILDEATSRVDLLTEQMIERALDKLLKERTCIIIAHKLKTLDRAHEILVLDNGRMIEHGSRKDLVKDKESTYSKLLNHGIEEVLV